MLPSVRRVQNKRCSLKVKGARVWVPIADGFLPVFLLNHHLMTEGSLTGLVHLADTLWALTMCLVLRSPGTPCLFCLGQTSACCRAMGTYKALGFGNGRRPEEPSCPSPPPWKRSFPGVRFNPHCSSKMACIICILKIRWTRAICCGQPSQEGAELGFCPQSQRLTCH